jgi:polysaccharide lyase-like protein
MKTFGIITIAVSIAVMVLVGYIVRYGQIPYFGGSSFYDGFESGSLDLSLWQLDSGEGCEMQVVESPGGRDGMSLSIKAEKGERCEILPRIRTNILGQIGHESRGRPLAYSFKIFIPDGQLYTKRNEVLAQWHSDPDTLLGDPKARGPAVALRALDGLVVISSGWDEDFISKSGRKDRSIWSDLSVLGKWIEWRFEITWSYSDDGRLKVWRDSELVLDHRGPNAYNDIRNVYLKIGVYHPGSDRHVYFDDFRFESL